MKLSKKASAALVIDVGTTTIKCLAFDSNLGVIYEREVLARLIRPKPHYIEQDAEQLYQLVYDLIVEAATELAGYELQIGLTNQRESVVMWDRQSTRALHNLISWQDSRTAAICASPRLKKAEAMVRQKTGLYITSYSSATKMTWLLKHVTQAKSSSLALGTLDSWLIYRLTGEFMTDYTNASRTLLFDIHKKAWDMQLLDLFGVKKEFLPSPQPSKFDYGKVTIGSRVIPVRVVMGDQQASLFAAGQSTGTVKITFGTGIFPMKIIGDSFQLRDNYITTLAATSGMSAHYALEGKIENAAKRVSPLLARPKELTLMMQQLARETAEVCKPLVSSTTKQVIVDGGISQNNTLLQAEADLLGVPVKRLPIHNGTALGVAALMLDRPAHN